MDLEYSAGIIAYRKNGNGNVEVMLSRSGCPYFKNEERRWTIQKGHVENHEDDEFAARREFHEETGFRAGGKLWRLGTFKVSKSKLVSVFYMKRDFDTSAATSNYFEMEWPANSGRTQSFPENDKAEWFPLSVAKEKVFYGQVRILERFEEELPRIDERERRRRRAGKGGNDRKKKHQKQKNRLFYCG